MNPLDNPDIVGEILAFTDRIPRYERVSRTFQQVTQPRVQQLVEYMDRYYPLWDKMDVHRAYISPSELQERYSVQRGMIEYLINRAAINHDWDVLLSLVDRYRLWFEVPEDAMKVAAINNNIEVANEIRRLYSKYELYTVEGMLEQHGKSEKRRLAIFQMKLAAPIPPSGERLANILMGHYSPYNKQMLDYTREYIVKYNLPLFLRQPPIVLKYISDLWPQEWDANYINNPVEDESGLTYPIQRYVISEVKGYPIPQDIAQYLNL